MKTTTEPPIILPSTTIAVAQRKSFFIMWESEFMCTHGRLCAQYPGLRLQILDAAAGIS